jgi:hypothetical protein
LPEQAVTFERPWVGFACGSIFIAGAASPTTTSSSGGIIAHRPCPQRSEIAAELMTREALGMADTGKTLAEAAAGLKGGA